MSLPGLAPGMSRGSRADDVVYASAYADLSTALAAAGGKRLSLGAGTYDLTASLTIPANTEIVGAGTGATVLRLAAGATFPALEINGVGHVAARGLSITKASGAAVTSRGYGVWIHGNASDVLIEDVEGDGLVSTIQTGYGATGASDGTCRRITLRHVTALNSPSAFGLCLDDCDILLLDDCHARANWLDGIKLRKATKNVTIRGGSSTGNGVGYLSNAGLYAGDGLDAYAGGDTLLIDGFVAEGNYGAAMQIKAGELNTGADLAAYGMVRNITISNVRASRNLLGAGLVLTINNFGTLTEPTVGQVQIIGGVYEENASQGMNLNGRNITIDGPICRKNGSEGILLGSRSFGVVINKPILIANGYPTPSGANAIACSGKNVIIRDPLVIGTDVEAGQDSDYDAGTTYTNRPVSISSSAPGMIEITGLISRRCAVNVPVVSSTTGTVLIHSSGTGNPGGQGSPGSTYVRSDTTNGYDQRWTKRGNVAPNSGSGWFRDAQVHMVTALPTAVAALKGLMLLKDNAGASEDTMHICVQTGASTYAWKQVTLV